MTLSRESIHLISQLTTPEVELSYAYIEPRYNSGNNSVTLKVGKVL